MSPHNQQPFKLNPPPEKMSPSALISSGAAAAAGSALNKDLC